MFSVLAGKIGVVLFVFALSSQSSCQAPSCTEATPKHTFRDVMLNAMEHSGLNLSAISEFVVAYARWNRGFACTPWKPQLWPLGRVPYEIGHGFSRRAQEVIGANLRAFESSACLVFVARTSQEVYVRLSPTPPHCFFTIRRLEAMYSGAGTRAAGLAPTGESSKPSTIDIELPNSYVEREGVLAHLLLALGFTRQELRHDRDSHISLMYPAAVAMFQHAFTKNPENIIDELFPYDAASATQLTPAAARGWGVTLRPYHAPPLRRGPTTGLSEMDIEKVRFVYCRAAERPTHGRGTSAPAGPLTAGHAEAPQRFSHGVATSVVAARRTPWRWTAVAVGAGLVSVALPRVLASAEGLLGFPSAGKAPWGRGYWRSCS